MRASSYLKGLYNVTTENYFGGRLADGAKLFYAPKIGKSDSVAKSTCAVTYFSDPPVIAIQRTRKMKSMRYVVAGSTSRNGSSVETQSGYEAQDRNMCSRGEMNG